MSERLSTEALQGMANAARPHGLRLIVPLRVLIPQIEDEPEDAYASFLTAVERGMLFDDDIETANEYGWIGRYKEYAQVAFFLEASATCYEMLIKAQGMQPALEDAKGNPKGLIDLKRAVDAFRSLTGQSVSDIVSPDDE